MIPVSVCIPALNSACHIEETIQSVLSQSLEQFELIVVDNGSTDGTVEIVEGFDDPRISLHHNPDQAGVGANWNRSIAAASGQYVKLLCHDDTIEPHCLERQVALLERHPNAALTAGKRHIIDESGRVLIAARGLRSLNGLVAGPKALRATVRSGTNIFGEPCCVLMRRDAMQRCGGFSGRLPYVIDLDYWCRMLRLGDIVASREVVAAFRVLSTSWSVALRDRQSTEIIELFENLRRQSAGAVTAADVQIGAARARSLALARIITYQIIRQRRHARSAATI